MERVGGCGMGGGGEERAEAVLKMERASVPCQPLSCFRGLPGIFLSLPLKHAADIGSEPE